MRRRLFLDRRSSTMCRLATLCGMILLMTTAAPLSAATFVYVSKAPESQIAVFRLNDDDGSLKPVGVVDVGGAPGSLAVSHDKKHLFASLRTTFLIGSYAIDPATGMLTLVNTTKLADGANAAYVATDMTDRYLFAASYAGGLVTVHAIDEAGTLGAEPLQVVETTKTAHAAMVHPNNKLVLVPHVAPNAVYQFQFDAATGKLTEAGQAPGGAEGAGPRHLAFHPSLKYAFTSNESGSGITLYALDAEQGLKPLQTLSTLPDGYAEKNTTADVKVHPSGRFVWVSNRGHDSLAGFAFDLASAKLTPLGQTPTEKTPRSFTIDPSGKYAYGAGEGSGKLAAYRIDESTGKLERFTEYEIGKSLTWVLAVPIP
ncbi:MAG: 6-phosphogluconolactonase [Pirellula sp.]|nr:6-phosphogluconolactonase [Pirellula sp.]